MEAFSASSVTDGRGEAHFTAGESGIVKVYCPAMPRRIELDRPVVEVRWEEALPIVATFVDQESMDPLPVSTGGNAATGPTHRIGWVAPRGQATADIGITPPDGWVWPARFRRASMGKVSRYARAVQVTIPVPRELRLKVAVTAANGETATGVSVRASMEDRDEGSLVVQTTANASGVATVRGLPFFRGERILVSSEHQVVSGDAREEGSSLFVLSNRFLDSVHAAIRLVPVPEEDAGPYGGPDVRATIGIAGRGGAAERNGGGTLNVTASTRLHAPAVGAAVVVRGKDSVAGTCDAQGRLTVQGLVGGSYEVWLVETGLVPSVTVVEVAGNGVTSVSVEEGAPRQVLIRVHDSDGVPLPGARVFAHRNDPYWIDAQVTNGTQTMQPRTDGAGEVRLVGLPAAGLASVRVRYGSRIVDVPLGEEDVVEVTVPRASDE